MDEAEKNIWWRLNDSWKRIVKSLPLIFIPIIGIAYAIICWANRIGIAIKLYKLKREMPDHPEFKKISKNYLLGIIVPIINQFLWSKAINSIMKFLEPYGIDKEDVIYVEKKGKIYANLGIIFQIILFGFIIVIFIFTFQLVFLTFKGIIGGPLHPASFAALETSLDIVIVMLIITIILLGFTIIVAVVLIVLEIKITNRLIKSISTAKLDISS